MEPVIIKKIIRRKRSATLILSDRKKVLLNIAILFHSGLQVGDRLLPGRIESLISESSRQTALDYALSLLSRRNYSAGLLRRKLLEKRTDPKLLPKIMAELTDKGFLNDRLFARRTVESILSRKPAGRRFLAAYLRSKLVPRVIADKIVAEILEDEDETALAVRLLQTKLKSLAKFDLETARVKAYNYLSRRAISYTAAKEAFEILRKEIA